MRKNDLFIVPLLTLLISFFFIPAVTAEITPESSPEGISTPTIPGGTLESTASPVSAEALAVPSAEVSISPESSVPASKESASTPPGEGVRYKGIPWGADFNKFKEIKNFSGNLDAPSAAFVSSSDDNDIALLLGVPVSDKGKTREQRIMFEYVPREFASVYFEPDDVYYIFNKGKFAMAFSRIAVSNFDLYRDDFYKKYQKTGTVAKQYAPSAKKTYQLEATVFKKGKTTAFLIKSQLGDKKNKSVSAKLVFVGDDLYAAIQNEIKANLAGGKQLKKEKTKQEMEKDLKKIE